MLRGPLKSGGGCESERDFGGDEEALEERKSAVEEERKGEDSGRVHAHGEVLLEQCDAHAVLPECLIGEMIESGGIDGGAIGEEDVAGGFGFVLEGGGGGGFLVELALLLEQAQVEAAQGVGDFLMALAAEMEEDGRRAKGGGSRPEHLHLDLV